MKTAEVLLSFMDRLQSFIQTVNHYIEQGLQIFHKVKEWIEKILSYIQSGIDRLVEAVGGRMQREDFLEFQQDDLFV